MRTKKRRVGITTASLVIGSIGAVYVGWCLLRPIQPLKPVVTLALNGPSTTTSLAWPNDSAQSAVGTVGSQLIDTTDPQTPHPTASTAKIITALVVLKAKPLTPKSQGPTITLSQTDVDLYNKYVAVGGSVVPVRAGETLTEYQMLQAIMLPSANNLADSLAIWAFGSLSAYAEAANSYLKQHDLSNTHVGSDASGLAPDTTSTAHDLVVLGKQAMLQPTLAGIVGQPTATNFPLVGELKNVNFLLGTNNIVGVKTGNSDQAGGAYVVAAKKNLAGKSITLVAASIGAPSLFAAMKSGLNLVTNGQNDLIVSQVAAKGGVVGYYSLPWGGRLPVITSNNLALASTTRDRPKLQTNLRQIAYQTSTGQPVGTITVRSPATGDIQSVTAQLQRAAAPPPLLWRLTHPFG